MRKKVISCLMVLSMIITLFASPINTFAAATSLTVQFNNGNSSASSNTISARFKVTNSGSSEVNLSDIKLRYYYTIDTEKTQSFFCDHAALMNGGSYTGVTSSVTSKFVKMSTTTSTADNYIEVGFSGGGSLAAGGTVEIQARVARTDWSNYDQSNDYSFKSAGSYIDWDQITAYIGSEKVYGKEPVEEQKDPTISPTTKSFVEGTATDIKVSLTPNGGTFKGITGLTESTDYTVSGTTVTILKNYLNGLAVGNKSLTFDFGTAGSATLALTVTPKGTDFGVTIGTVGGNSGETVTVPISFENVAKANNVGTCNFYATYDTSLLEATAVAAGPIITNSGVNFSSSINKDGSISFLFLDNTIGSELIKTDGVFANITFKIKDTTKEVATPVAFKEGGAFGDGEMAKITKVILTDGSVEINMNSKPTISPTTKSFVEGTATDIKVLLTPNGGTFKGITGLAEGTDYTVSGTTVTILKNYLNGLAVGNKSLTFDFGTAGSATLALTVTPKGTDFGVTIGTVGGNSGDTVTVPISFENVAKANNVGTCNFYATYDTSLLETTAVAAGPIITNSGVNFSSSINKDGSISFLFLDNTIGSELIKTDGVFANITFKIKDTTKEVATPVAFKEGGAFGDGEMAKITKVILTDGSVEINMNSKPTISPTTKSFVEGTATDIKVSLTPNGGTFKGITGLTEGTDYTVSGTTVTILKNYLNGLAVGNKSLTFDFGTAGSATLALTVTPKGTDFGVTIGTVGGNSGETVTLPISFENVAKANNVGTCNFYATYDTSLLEATAVAAGPIITNSGVNFSSSINKDGSISFLFLDNTIGNELIKTDGVFANITFKIKDTTEEVSTPVAFKAGGAFGDGEMAKITKVILTDGIVDINKVIVQDPTISPETTSLVKGAATADLKVELTPKGNTFKGITGLTKDTDFAVTGNTVTILKSYLNSLAVGTKALTFDFGSAKNPVLTITVTENTGTLDAKIGSVACKAGDTVKLPISLSNVSKVGKIGVGNIVVTYDTGILEATAVSSGSIVPNEADNFFYNINNDGTISIIYISATDNGLIGTDGEFANIEFKVKSDAVPATSPVSFKSGTFGDADWTKIKTVNKTNGCVTIRDNKPSINPSTVTFNKAAPADITIGIVYNGIILKGITGLTKGTEYTISDNKAKLTILKSYLSTLDVGTKELTFNFDMDKNLVLTLTIINSVPKLPSISPKAATFDKYAPADITLSVVYNGIILKGITGLTKGTDYTISENKAKITILKSYLSTLPVGTKDITFNFDSDNNLILNLSVVDSTPEIPSISPTSATFDKYVPQDVTATITPNGKTFDGITGLTQGTNYTISGNTVTILKSYLSTLEVGTKELTFDFGLSSNPVLKLTMLDSTPEKPASISPATATFDKYVPKDLSVTLTPNGNAFKGITGLTQGTNYTISGNTVTILKSYLSTLEVGTKELTFDFGLENNPVFTLTVVDSTPPIKGLGVTIGKASGSAGNTITVPITLKNVSKVGNIGTCNFYINYDTSKLEVQKVTAGSIVKNASVNFTSSINSGTISFLFLDNSIGSELITADGVLATITLKVIGSSNAALTFKDGGAFGDGNFNKVTEVTYTSGSVN